MMPQMQSAIAKAMIAAASVYLLRQEATRPTASVAGTATRARPVYSHFRVSGWGCSRWWP
jgi:hypothetical protein